MDKGRSASVALAASNDVSRVEAPVTAKAYAMCAFAAFGGIFFGFVRRHRANRCIFCLSCR